MKISENKNGDVLIICLEGRLDSSNSMGVEKKVLAFIDGGEKKILFDLSQLDYISSVGLRIFLLAAKGMEKIEGKLVLCGLKEHIKEVFDLSCFSALFPIFLSQEEAVKALK